MERQQNKQKLLIN